MQPIVTNDTDPRAATFLKLLGIMDDLRAQCPWDKKQTMQSLRHLTIEEVYELADAIDKQQLEEIKKELGDVLLHIVFYAKIASEIEAFDITDVIQSLCEKLIHRHPHIYGDVQVADEEEVKKNWEKLKVKEGNTSILQGVPKALPSLIKAIRIQEKARAVGFDWENVDQVAAKVAEELHEFLTESDPQKQYLEFGDLLFALVNYARFKGINPDEALEKTNQKFIQRFQYMEKKLFERGQQFSDLTLKDMDEYWNEAKRNGL